MAEYVAKHNPNRCPTHPGELLRDEVIPATGKTKTEIAALLGISRQHLYDILEERKPVSPAVAVRLGKLFGRAKMTELSSLQWALMSRRFERFWRDLVTLSSSGMNPPFPQ